MFKVKEGLLVGGKIATGSGVSEIITRADLGSMAFQNASNFTVDKMTTADMSLDDTDSGYFLSILSTSTLSANRQLVFDVDDVSRILRITGNCVLSGTNTGDQTISFGSTGLTPNTATGGNVIVAGTLIPSSGGTGLSSVSNVGELYFGNTGSIMGRIAPVAVGSYLASNGVSSAPVWTAFPAINNGSLSLSIGSAAETNTTITVGTGTGYSANTASNISYDIKIGPSLSALSAIMTGASAGFIKKTAQDAYTLDNFSYTATNTGNALVQRDSGGSFSAGTITATLSGTASNATNLGGYPRRVDLTDFTTWDASKSGAVGWYNISGGPAAWTYYHGFRTSFADANYGSEIAIKSDTDNVWFRRAVAGSYTSWQEFITDANIVSKSAGLSVSYSGTSGLAAKASTLSQGGANGAAMTFSYSAQAGQPTYLWGTTDGVTTRVYNPSNFNVNYASTASTLTGFAVGGFQEVGRFLDFHAASNGFDYDVRFQTEAGISNGTGTLLITCATTLVQGGLATNGVLVVGNSLAESTIIMSDGDNGPRKIHCNSDKVGFLNTSDLWGSYCDDAGNWRSNYDMYASNFYGTASNASKTCANVSSINTNFTAVAGYHYVIGWSGSSQQVTLPATPSVGDTIYFTVDLSGSGMQINPGTKSIQGTTGNMILNITVQRQTFGMKFVEDNASTGWCII